MKRDMFKVMRNVRMTHNRRVPIAPDGVTPARRRVGTDGPEHLVEHRSSLARHSFASNSASGLSNDVRECAQDVR